VRVVRLYSDIPHNRGAAMLRDLLVLVLVFLFAWLGVKVHDSVASIASVPRSVADSGAAIRGGFEDAGDSVGDAPVIGGTLRDALRNSGGSAGGRIEASGRAGEQDVHRLANVLGWLMFLLPAAVLLVLFLPGRLREVRRLTAASRAIGPELTPERCHSLAARAAYGLAYERLMRHTRDPLGDLEAGRYDGLVAAALEEAGIRAR
jgi:hypothetical protein